MEGVGSRLGRASSRYGPSASAAVFNGPVRKWRKKWVHVSPSSTVSHHNSHSHSNGHTNNSSRLLLCRWTPLSPAAAADASSSEEPPKRKFRYTPIAVLEEQRKAAKKFDHEAKAGSINQFTELPTSKNDEQTSDTALKTETQDSSTSNLDLGLCLKGHNGDHDNNNLGQSKEGEMKKASAGGFWTTS
ncbi:uncharacterized protein LOC110669957 [Hevea brasiliensis]|uniref:uncharacterized protein LOC110669957 n=1 Tax=Hevea brasiliensis TaxID=3981 RepID=UPI0025E5B120|nr:uncharacterized protein LOC110669957 [Hevea brasiliensis]